MLSKVNVLKNGYLLSMRLRLRLKQLIKWTRRLQDDINRERDKQYASKS
jgi:hypothetical protein